MKKEEIRDQVRERYAGVARGAVGCYGGETDRAGFSRRLGYEERDLSEVPDGVNLGLGCGNPVAHASLRPGEVVVDLGSGAGFDCLLAARRVGPSGRILGVDMTPEMIERARRNAEAAGISNVEFRLGEIEALPVETSAADAVISNCVINLSSDKPKVFQEAFRVLKPGGRLMISDLVLNRPLPESVRSSVSAYVGCIAGALLKEEYLAAIRSAGFREVRILGESPYPVGESVADDTEKALLGGGGISDQDRKAAAEAVVSLSVVGVKPSL